MEKKLLLRRRVKERNWLVKLASEYCVFYQCAIILFVAASWSGGK